MIASLLQVLFGCGHRNLSFPITAKRGQRLPAAAVTGTYVVCLHCGQEFPYDWNEMKVVSASRKGGNAIAKPVETYAGK